MNNPNFYKQIDAETKKKCRQFARISKINNFQRIKDKSIPKIRTRFLLYNYFKKCFWCDVETVYSEIETPRPPSNFATIDHLRSRFFRNKGEETLKLLSCHRCNQLRADIENKKYTSTHIQKLNALSTSE